MSFRQSIRDFMVPVLHLRTALFCVLFLAFGAIVAQANGFQETLRSALAKAERSEPGITEFYRARNFEAIWVGNKNRARRAGLVRALRSGGAHGLPVGTYGISELETALKARDISSSVQAELKASVAFVTYARDLNSGVLRPSRVDREIALRPAVLSAKALLEYAVKTNPKQIASGLKPKSETYAALLREKEALERVIGRGGYGPTVKAKKIEPGDSGAAVQALRTRLNALGYKAGSGSTYDASLQKALKRFQTASGLNPDGVAGKATLNAVNMSAEEKLRRVVANMERERWLPNARGKRHIYVNIADALVTVYDNGRPTFTSKTVVGKDVKDQRTPEFSDEMAYMVINPTWHVPASIAGKEYLPILKTDPGFLSRRNMKLLNRDGQQVSAAAVDFSQYGETNFPYLIKQRPDPANALGLVKFMFPNRYNIYLHDTPSKSLFNRDYRAFSHGCVRVAKPFEFAYHLLARQTSNPEKFFQSKLATKQETYVNLKEPVPIYITYHTALRAQDGSIRYRADVYGRDAKIFKALTGAGVRLQSRGS
ncbi:MAG: L,D-transpeptidase family protein [Pseudomonadota bacterium]